MGVCRSVDPASQTRRQQASRRWARSDERAKQALQAKIAEGHVYFEHGAPVAGDSAPDASTAGLPSGSSCESSVRKANDPGQSLRDLGSRQHISANNFTGTWNLRFDNRNGKMYLVDSLGDLAGHYYVEGVPQKTVI